jgi:hypothetical protein
VTFAIRGQSGAELTRALWDRASIVCRAALSGNAVRISVAFFTTESELVTLGDVVRNLAGVGIA